MNNNTTFSLSLQKQIEQKKLNLHSEIDASFKALRIKTMLQRSNIKKERKGIQYGIYTVLLYLASIFKKIYEMLLGYKIFIKSNKCPKRCVL